MLVATTSYAAARPPNILLIVAEDLGVQLGCYGDARARTPHLDALAGQGVRFEHAYVTQAGCSPSRASLLTGLYPHQHGQIALATHRFEMFSADIPNLPRLLREHGYRTGCIGKIHVNPESAFAFHHHRGGSASFSPRDVRAVAREAGEFITQGGAPFFLMVNYADAHDPWLAQSHGLPEKPFSASEIEPLPFVGLRTAAALKATADYYSCISRLDTGVGLLLEVLANAGHADDTLVIFVSDHGPAMPRGKMTSYEGGVRVPLIIRLPGRFSGGLVDARLVSTIDLMPTVLALCDGTAPAGLPGRSLVAPGSPPEGWREVLFTEFTLHWSETYYPQRTVRDARYKLIHNLASGRPNPIAAFYRTRGPSGGTRFEDDQYPELLNPALRESYRRFAAPPEWELYDLTTDPLETRNLAADMHYADILVRLGTKLREWQEETGDALRVPENLGRLEREVAATFEDGQYRHVARQQGFQWRYRDYLAPHVKSRALQTNGRPSTAR